MSAAATPDAVKQPHVPKHQAFTWLATELERNPHAQFMALTMDIVRGAELCLQVAQAGALDECHEAGSAYFNATERERLVALAIGSLQLLGSRIEADIFDMNTSAQKGGAA